MKKFLFFLLLLFLPTFVYAEDILLDELSILNGELSIPFDTYNTEYTVSLDETEFNVEFDYKVKDGITVSVNNNHDLENDSVVTLTISKEEKKLDYHFHILKNVSNSVVAFNTQQEINEESFMFKYKLYVIPTTCFILILICYKILFRKHKKKII